MHFFRCSCTCRYSALYGRHARPRLKTEILFALWQCSKLGVVFLTFHCVALCSVPPLKPCSHQDPLSSLDQVSLRMLLNILPEMAAVVAVFVLNNHRPLAKHALPRHISLPIATESPEQCRSFYPRIWPFLTISLFGCQPNGPRSSKAHMAASTTF